MPPVTRLPIAGSLTLLGLLAAPAAAENRTWNRPLDPATVYPWNTTDLYWNSPTLGATTWNNANKDTALFNEAVSGAGSGTQRITLPGTISLNNMTFLYINPSAATVSNWKLEGTGPLNFTPVDTDLGSRISIGAANAVVEI